MANKNFFTPDTVDMHNDEEQLERQESLYKLKISIDRAKNFGKVGDIDGTSHIASLSSCSCDDFLARQLPCIHMYKYAHKVRCFSIKRESRSLTFIADFSKGYADGWAYVVRSCNYSELDILYTPRITQKESQMVLTQGRAYNFISNSVFYDTPLAYQDAPWEKIIPSLNTSLQIDKTTPTYSEPVVILNDNGILERRTNIIYGEVWFTFYKINGQKTMRPVSSHRCSQDEFLALLRSGNFVDHDGNRQKLL